MRIKPANKRQQFSRKERKSERRDIYKLARAKDLDAQPPDLFGVDVLTDTAGFTDFSRVHLTITMLTEELLRRGYTKIEIVSESTRTALTDKKLSRQDVIRKFKDRRNPTREHVVATVDIKKYINKRRIQNLANRQKENLEDSDDQRYERRLQFVKSAKRKPVDNETKQIPQAHKSSQDDKQGILEIRLGKDNRQFNSEATIDNENREDLFDQEKIEQEQRAQTQSNVMLPSLQDQSLAQAARKQSAARKEYGRRDTVDPILRLLKGPKKLMTNKRRPSCITRSAVKNSIKLPPRRNVSTGRSNRETPLPKPPQRPFVKRIIERPVRQVDVVPLAVQFPNPGSRIFIRLVGEAPWFMPNRIPRRYRKRIPLKRIRRLPLKKTYPFLDDKFLPRINVMAINNAQTLVRITNIDDAIENICVYRREISSRALEDEYEKVFDSEVETDEVVFFDVVGDAKAYKYVCVPDKLPLYTYTVYVDRNFTYENFKEPRMFAFQRGQNVVIQTSNIPREAKKVLFYRKSSIEDEEQLVDGVSLFGRQSRRQGLRIIDEPSPIEQTLTYRLETINEDGIVSSFEERPQVLYTSAINARAGTITKFVAKYNSVTDEVDINGECFVENMFITANDASLKNPDEEILKAAARRQLLVKIQIRRIDNKTGDDEIILREIINPGLSKFDTELRALNRIKFKFSDSGENAATFGYTPLFSFRKYTYIARIIVYPIGIELRKVSDFEKIKGVVAPGRIDYQFDPGIFDHPLNTELGIMPARGSSDRGFFDADNIGQTARALVRRVAVKESDIADSVSITNKVLIDSRFDPVARLNIKVPEGLLDDLDHVELIMSYDTVAGEDVIDRLYLDSTNTEYFDYTFDDLAANSVSYKIRGIGLDFQPIFTSSETKLSLNDDNITRARQRKKSLRRSIQDREKNLKRARSASKRKLKRMRRG